MIRATKHVENQREIELLKKALVYSIKSDLKTHLKNVLVNVRTYRRGFKEIQESLRSMPCGYQDAHGDRVDELFFEYEALKIAWRLKQGDASRAFEVMSRAVGDL